DMATAKTKLLQAERALGELESKLAKLTEKFPPGDLAQLHATLTQELENSVRARDALARVFSINDPQQVNPRYPHELEAGAEDLKHVRDLLTRLQQAETARDGLAKRQAALDALDDQGLLPVSDRVGVRPAADPRAVDPEMVVIGTDTDPNGYRQALNAVLPVRTDLNMVMGLADSGKLPVSIRFTQLQLDEQGRYQGTVDLPSIKARLTERVGSWPDPKKHARAWEKTRWTEPQPPFLLKFSAVPSFDKMLVGLHDFAPGEVPAFLYPQNPPFAPKIYSVPEGTLTWSSDIGLEVFHARILIIGILERIPGHQWVKTMLRNRPWIGHTALTLTQRVPANTAQGKSVEIPLSAEFVRAHPSLTNAVLQTEQWIPAVRDGAWIQLVPVLRGARTYAWNYDSQPDPQSLHRQELAKPVLNAEQARLDGTALPYSGESVEIPAALAERWAANEAAREQIQAETEAAYAEFEDNRLHGGDSHLARIVNNALTDPDRYSGGDPKRWVRGPGGAHGPDANGATRAKP
ncbi:hypothetical protein, partial [Streptomyces roseolus]|uniref:hypothetical protein n=1 Tax=Streptomyces roseolus TaxID=67358 RepID=UPI00364A9F85